MTVSENFPPMLWKHGVDLVVGENEVAAAYRSLRPTVCFGEVFRYG